MKMDSVISLKRQPKTEDVEIYENILNNSTIHESLNTLIFVYWQLHRIRINETLNVYFQKNTFLV